MEQNRVCARKDCQRDLTDEMGVYVFVSEGGNFIRGPWNDALLCVEHGKNGHNMMSRATWEVLTA